MGFLDRITVLVLTRNEEANLGRTLAALRPFPRVVVLDSGSSDRTVEIARESPNVHLATRAFDTHAAQWNHGLQSCGIDSEWVLALDADYVLTPELVDEISGLTPPEHVVGYRASFRYCIDGKPLRGSVYPPVVVLYRRLMAHYVQDGHTQRIRLGRGHIGELRGRIRHDDRKPFSAWISSQDRYSQLECASIAAARWRDLGWKDRLRRMLVITPWLVPLYCLTVQRGLLDGRRGCVYALERCIAESMLSARLLRSRIAAGEGR